LRRAFLSGTYLFRASLIRADLSEAQLRIANLIDAELSGAVLSGAVLSGADLSGAVLSGTNLSGVQISKEQPYVRGTIGLDEAREDTGSQAKLRIRVIEEPLTAQNLTTILSALTELSTKYWLIAKGRFADLIEYTQTHNGRFAEEANIVVTRVSYNSPFNMDWKVDISAPSVAEALVTTIDGIAQRQERLEKAKHWRSVVLSNRPNKNNNWPCWNRSGDDWRSRSNV